MFVQWFGFIIGVAIVIITWGSVINSIILPRSIRSRITFYAWITLRAAFSLIANRMHKYERKDRFLAYLGPASLLAMLITWLALFLFGFALMFWPFSRGDFGSALYLSGSSILTLGIATSLHPGAIVLEFVAAASGLVVIALQIGYLPAIYGSYNRRETLVTSLSTRTSLPAWGPEILASHYRTQAIESLPVLFLAWETWMADVNESHISYPSLLAFRSADPMQSWVVSWLAMMDAAALFIALAPSQAPPETRQCLSVGIMGLHHLSRMTHPTRLSANLYAPIDEPPETTARLPYDQFLLGYEHLRTAGFPIECDAKEAWETFTSWRVHYEEQAYRLANFTVAVPAPWSGRRKNMTHQDVFDVLASRPRIPTPDAKHERPTLLPHTHLHAQAEQVVTEREQDHNP